MATGLAIFIDVILEVALDAVKLVDQVQRDIRTSRLALGLHFLRFDKLAPCMRPAAQTLNSGLCAQRVVTSIIVSHHVAAIAIEQARRHLLRPAGGIVKKDHRLVRRATGLHPHPGLAAWLPIRLFEHLHARFIAVDDAAGQQAIAHQIEQRLKVLTALDDPAGQGLARDIDAMTAQHLFETVKR
ncbi:hypothetical protein PS870_06532 [Pseudomonas fluorescens]|uniref:Uncharacterized protein n=1 Tax=Pseudomonas fluorescens TaxID=294 RepID=A0A5E7QJB9_PSEFL|nr:hypothetical protein PS870_06532 [Pseudomonas fluorescens]